MSRILVVDDEINMRRVLAALLEAYGHTVAQAGTVLEALAALAAGEYEVVLTDHQLPDGEGLRVVRACHEATPPTPVIVLTAFAKVELAVESMRCGAFDFLTKPFEPETVRGAISRAIERKQLQRENARLQHEVRRLAGGGLLLGDSAVMQKLRADIERVAPVRTTILITGETGSGKELVARALHAASPRAASPFIAINCSALTESLLESELFGHERGAFTGADRAHMGLFEAADGGTLFLDEAGEMSLPLQTKLLRVLQEGVIQRVGSTQPRRVDVRVLVATHRDLAERLREGLFREDLYYRLVVVTLVVPALRERVEDVPGLARHFIHEIARTAGMSTRPLGAEAEQTLLTYAWPGNVRELRNAIERALLLARGSELTPADLGLPLASSTRPEATRALSPRSPTLPVDLREMREHIEREWLTRALHESQPTRSEP